VRLFILFSEMDDKTIHDTDFAWLKESDVVVAEVTVPSTGVGYELGRAVEMKKPILALYRCGGPLSQGLGSSIP